MFRAPRCAAIAPQFPGREDADAAASWSGDVPAPAAATPRSSSSGRGRTRSSEPGTGSPRFVSSDFRASCCSISSVARARQTWRSVGPPPPSKPSGVRGSACNAALGQFLRAASGAATRMTSSQWTGITWNGYAWRTCRDVSSRNDRRDSRDRTLVESARGSGVSQPKLRSSCRGFDIGRVPYRRLTPVQEPAEPFERLGFRRGWLLKCAAGCQALPRPPFHGLPQPSQSGCPTVKSLAWCGCGGADEPPGARRHPHDDSPTAPASSPTHNHSVPTTDGIHPAIPA